MDSKKYRVRYSVEIGEHEAPSGGTVIANGIRISDTDYGYADDLFVVSLVDQGDGKVTLLAMREAINHHLEHHY